MRALRPGEVSTAQLIAADDAYRFLRAQPCYACGRRDGGIKASASLSGTEVTRLFCHNDERSCYQKNSGELFDDWPQ